MSKTRLAWQPCPPGLCLCGVHLLAGEALMDFRKASAEELLASDPLRDYFVWWDRIRQSDVDSLREAIDTAKLEQDLQAYLEEHPHMLIQHLGGGHGRWVIPHQRLGAEHVTDFFIGERDSMGFTWVAVELESPRARMFTAKGDPTKELVHAMRQVANWRAWLKTNQNYAAQTRDNGGLGLKDIGQDVAGLIIIGRDCELRPDTRNLRRQIAEDSRIDIHTYDWLVRNAQGRVDSLTRYRSQD